MRETWVWSLGWEDPLEKEMATHSSILAWRIPWMEEPGGLQSMASQRVGHDWATSLYFSPAKPRYKSERWMRVFWEFSLSPSVIPGRCLPWVLLFLTYHSPRWKEIWTEWGVLLPFCPSLEPDLGILSSHSYLSLSIILSRVDPTLVWFVVLNKCLLNEWVSPSLLRSLPIIVCHRDSCILRAGFFFFLNIYIYFIEVELTYNVSGAQQSD